MRASEYSFFDAPFLAFAHRGGAHYRPNLGRENTLYAFGQAVDLGYRYLETDVHATADGVLVAFHDDRLDRVADRVGMIAELSWAELSGVQIGGQDTIPVFTELLAAFPQVRFNVDAKSEQAVDLLAAAIHEHEAYERVCVSSFSPARLHRLRSLLPGVASAVTSRGVLWNRFAPWLTGLLNSPAPAFQLPISHRWHGRQIRILTPRLIAAAHRAGKHVHVWTVDEAAEIDRLLDAGVDGIFTDRVDTLKDVLTSRNLWS